jgi:hypothetical protein
MFQGDAAEGEDGEGGSGAGLGESTEADRFPVGRY